MRTRRSFRAKTGNFVVSDVDLLKAVIVHTPGMERRHVLTKFGFISDLGFSTILLGDQAEEQHRGFLNILERGGVRVLNIRALVDNALVNLKKKGLLSKWLSENFSQATGLLREKTIIDADDLIGASDRSFYRFNDQGGLSPVTRPLLAMFFTRDFGVALPEGVILSNFGNKRAPESRIARLIFSFADQLRDIPIVLDAEKEGVLVQGGDVIVYDRNTIFMGIDNLSSRQAAALIARKLNKTVLGVKLTSYNSFISGAGGSLASLFLHLDSVFNLADRDKSLVVPYFFESRFTNSNPLASVMKGARVKLSRSLDKPGLESIIKRFVFEINLKNVGEELRELGGVTEFVAGSGEQLETGMKLVDYLKEKLGHKIIYVGGDPPSRFEDQVKHMVEEVIPEIYYQAANVFAIEPGEVVMYRSNTTATQAALLKSGVKVTTIEGSDLVRWSGGPHCMTMPIARAKVRAS